MRVRVRVKEQQERVREASRGRGEGQGDDGDAVFYTDRQIRLSESGLVWGFFFFSIFFWKRASSILGPARIEVEVAAWYKGLGLLLRASPSPSRQRVTVESTSTIIIIIIIIMTIICSSVAIHDGAAGEQNRPGPLLPVSCPVCQTKLGKEATGTRLISLAKGVAGEPSPWQFRIHSVIPSRNCLHSCVSVCVPFGCGQQGAVRYLIELAHAGMPAGVPMCRD